MLNTVHVKFEDSRYNYSTSVSDNTDEADAVAYFVGTGFNLGGMAWDHDRDCETEVDDVQVCTGIVFEGGC